MHCSGLVPPSSGPVRPTPRVVRLSLLAGAGPVPYFRVVSDGANQALVIPLLHGLGNPHPVKSSVDIHVSLLGPKVAQNIMVGLEDHLACCLGQHHLGDSFISPRVCGIMYKSALFLT